MKDFTSMKLLGLVQSMITLIFLGSTATPSVEIMWPKYSIYF
jgi:hypothetical protein